MTQNKSRVESFSDAVFAFAATLIVVSFEVPEDFTALRALMKDFISFAISFLVLFMMWKLHYNFFRRVDFVDNVIIAVNAVLLFVILFYVYPMKFIANSLIGKSRLSSFDELGDLFIIYSIGFVLIFICFFILYRYAARQTSKLETVQLLKFYSNHFGIFVFTGFLSILLSILNVGMNFGLPGFVYMLLGPLCWLHASKFGTDIQD